MIEEKKETQEPEIQKEENKIEEKLIKMEDIIKKEGEINL